MGENELRKLEIENESLRVSNERNRIILESITDGFMVLDKEWRLSYFNESGYRITGIKKKDMIGSIVWELFPHATSSGFYREFYRAVEINTPVHFVEFYPEPLNRWLECHCFPSTEGLSVYVRDITKRKKVEEALRQLNETLEQQVAERTELAERRARQLQALALQLTLTEQRERRRIAEILHDDFQQLMVAAKMRQETLIHSIDNALVPAAEDVLKLVKQSISVSRSLTAELSPLVLQQGRLSAALQWLVHWFQEKHGLTVELQIAPNTDVDQEEITVLMFQSIRELLFNVVKHSGVKSARVEMSFDKENRLRVAVSDQGLGLDPDRTWEKTQDSSAFGLFSIRERLTLMGGSLEVESSPGHGATFSLMVPIENTVKKNKSK